MADLPSDALIASLCQEIYSPTALIGEWDHFDLGADDGVCWCLKKVDGFDIVVFRGSLTLQDWLRDVYVLPLGQSAPLKTRVGHVHAGFYLGMEQMWTELRPMLTQPVIVTGHSLGGARACILTALMVADGSPPVRRVTFGEPKTGLIDFCEFVKDIPASPYRNGDAMHHDQVTDVPPSILQCAFDHPNPVNPVTCKPQGFPEIAEAEFFFWHHIPLYVAAVAALKPMETAQ